MRRVPSAWSVHITYRLNCADITAVSILLVGIGSTSAGGLFVAVALMWITPLAGQTVT